jgi:hypothetical protein
VSTRLRYLPHVWAVVLAVVLLGPALGPGYVLSYDMVWVPHLAMRSDFLGFGTALPRAVPSDAVVAVLDNLVPAMLLQKLALLLPLVAAAVGMTRLVGSSVTARLTAVTLTVWNPFTVERLWIGHWTILIGYAVLPWLVLAGRSARRTGRVPLVVWLLLPLGSLSATAGLVSALALLVTGWSGGRDRLRPNALLVLATLAGNAPWLVAGLLHAGSATVSGTTSAFALHAEGSLPAPLAALGLGGIWNSQVVPGSRETFLSWLSLVLLLALAAYGARLWGTWLRGERTRLVALWAIGFAVAFLTWAAPGMVGGLAAHLPGGGLLRDGTRCLALCLPLYAGLPAAGAEHLARRAGHGDPEIRRLLAGACAALPVLLLYDAAWGAADSLRPADYPSSWAAAQDVDLSGGDLLVLPFTAYRAPAWNHGHVVLDPLGRYLPADFLADDVLVVSGETLPGEDPRVPQAVDALRQPDAATRTQALLDLGVRDVAVELDVTGATVPDLDASTTYDAPGLRIERLDGTASPREVSTGDRWAMGAAWAGFAGSLLAGLAGLVLSVVRRIVGRGRQHVA